MCLKHPEHAPTNIDDLTRSTGPAGGALPPASPRPRCRPKLWELEAKLHCPIIGTCLSLEALRRVARRFRFEAAHDEYGMHVEAVGFSQQRNPSRKPSSATSTRPTSCGWTASPASRTTPPSSPCRRNA